MALLWPKFLVFLVLIPLLVVIYIWILKRQQRFVVRYPSLSLMRGTRSNVSWLRKYLPFLLFLTALASLLIALSRPVTSRAVASSQTTIMLTIDVSRSMCATDISPNRLEAVKAVARSFIQHPVVGTQIGVVAFAAFAELIQDPTADSHLLDNAIGSLTTDTSTAIGSAILRSLDAIAAVDKSVAPSQDINPLLLSPARTRAPTAAGKYVAHIIVLLTDGANNVGPLPLDAAEQAAERGVRIYPIGFGTMGSPVIDCSLDALEDPSGASGFGPSDGGFKSAIDAETLKQIAQITGGQYYPAASAAELRTVFQDLQRFIAVSKETTEVSVLFIALGALMAIAAFILSLLWRPLL